MNSSTVQLYCPRCCDIFETEDSNLDGAFFGPNLPVSLFEKITAHYNAFLAHVYDGKNGKTTCPKSIWSIRLQSDRRWSNYFRTFEEKIIIQNFWKFQSSAYQQLFYLLVRTEVLHPEKIFWFWSAFEKQFALYISQFNYFYKFLECHPARKFRGFRGSVDFGEMSFSVK